MKHRLLKPLFLAASVLTLLATECAAQYSSWQHSGSIFILTTPEGADLPASAAEKEFPLLVRLHKDFFDFSQAKADGADVRFSTSAGEPLAYQIEEWDAVSGTASIWVRIPTIKGNARQEIRLPLTMNASLSNAAPSPRHPLTTRIQTKPKTNSHHETRILRR